MFDVLKYGSRAGGSAAGWRKISWFCAKVWESRRRLRRRVAEFSMVFSFFSHMGLEHIANFMIYLSMKNCIFECLTSSFACLAVSVRFSTFFCVDSRPQCAKRMRPSPFQSVFVFYDMMYFRSNPIYSNPIFAFQT